MAVTLNVDDFYSETLVTGGCQLDKAAPQMINAGLISLIIGLAIYCFLNLRYGTACHPAKRHSRAQGQCSVFHMNPI